MGRGVAPPGAYALCNDRRTLLWFANQRAVEYHPALVPADRTGRAPHIWSSTSTRRRRTGSRWPCGGPRSSAGRWPTPAWRERSRRAAPRACTSSCRSTDEASTEEAAAATRALAARAERLDPALTTTAFIREDRGGKVFLDSTRAGGATVVAAYSPRARPGLPVSFPVPWDDLDRVAPADFTVHTAAKAHRRR